MNDYVSKPIAPETLLAAIHRQMGGKNDEGGPVPQPCAPLVSPSDIFDGAELLRRLGGNEKIFQSIVEQAAEQFPAMMAELKTLTAQGDFEKLRFCAHTLKGSFANIAAHQLRDLAAALERAAREQDRQTVEQTFSQMESPFERFMRRLQEELT